MKPTKCPAREKKNEARKAKKEGRREMPKFCFLRMPELRKLIFASGSEGRQVYDL